jgi:EAL domain-containing protein (putative c-di-GMP-specific phosphodiesterase class I)
MGSTLWSHLARLPVDLVLVDVRDLATSGDADRALQLLSAIARGARAFAVDTVATQVSTPQMLGELRDQGLVALSGPVLPCGLTALQVVSLLRHPSAAPPMAVPRPRAGV